MLYAPGTRPFTRFIRFLLETWLPILQKETRFVNSLKGSAALGGLNSENGYSQSVWQPRR